MNRSHFFRRLAAPALALALLCACVPPASAFFGLFGKQETPVIPDFSKNGLVGTIITFSREDFSLPKDTKVKLQGILIDTLPDPNAGTLTMGGQPLEAGSFIDVTALDGLTFQSAQAPTVMETTVLFTPAWSSGEKAQQTTITIHLLTEQNAPPVARNMDLSTYRNIAITGYFDAVDTEGDVLTFQLTSTPARGAVTLAEDGSSQFVYTPYENKTGRDSFTYVAMDPSGNTSPEATVTVRIEKADTKVTYADLEGHSAHRAAIRLAEEGICTGQYVNGRYFFEPDAPVSRTQFLTMALATAGVEPLEDVTQTGFADDSAIPTWAKGAISAALQQGAITGSKDENGAPVFGADRTITRAEAAVLLNNILQVTDVPAEVFFDGDQDHWAAQACANLAASGILRPEEAGPASFSLEMTRADAAEMLCGALDMLEARKAGSWFPW